MFENSISGKFCADYPRIEDFTHSFVAFVRTSAPAALNRQEDAQNSYMQQQIQELNGENKRLLAMVEQLPASLNTVLAPLFARDSVITPQFAHSGSLGAATSCALGNNLNP